MKAVTIFMVIVVAYLFVSSMNSYYSLKPDNIAEEAIEAAIQTTTGISLDLTPESME